MSVISKMLQKSMEDYQEALEKNMPRDEVIRRNERVEFWSKELKMEEGTVKAVEEPEQGEQIRIWGKSYVHD